MNPLYPCKNWAFFGIWMFKKKEICPERLMNILRPISSEFLILEMVHWRQEPGDKDGQDGLEDAGEKQECVRWRRLEGIQPEIDGGGSVFRRGHWAPCCIRRWEKDVLLYTLHLPGTTLSISQSLTLDGCFFRMCLLKEGTFLWANIKSKFNTCRYDHHFVTS